MTQETEFLVKTKNGDEVEQRQRRLVNVFFLFSDRTMMKPMLYGAASSKQLVECNNLLHIS